MVRPRDFVALAVWLFLLPILKIGLERYWEDIRLADIVFVAVVILISLQLVWLRVGYPAP